MKFKKPLLAALVIVAALFGITSTASAGVYCVGPGTNCATSPVVPFDTNAAGITAAINAATAHAGDDVLFIAPGLYPITSTTFPALPASADDLIIMCAGAGQTIFTGTADGISPLIDLQLPNADSALDAFTLNVNFTSNFATGISAHRGMFNDFEINQTGTVSNGAPASGIEMHDGARSYFGTVTSSGNASGMSLPDGETTMRYVSFTGAGTGTGIYVYGTADTSLSSLRIVGYGTGVRIAGGSVGLDNSLIDMQAVDNAGGLYVNDQDSGVPRNIVVHAARNTIVGSGAAATGVYINTQEIGDTSTGSYDDMLIYGSDPSFNSWLCFGVAGATPQFDFSGLASNVAPSFGANCNETALAPAPLLLSGSPFQDFAARNLRPAWNSPVVDAGGTTADAWDNDLDEGSHRVDGDNDGTVTSDIGAFEYQAEPPSGSISAPSTAAIGQTIALTHSMTDPDPTDSVAGVLWNFGDGSISTQNAPSHAYSAAGNYDVTVSATNEAGFVGTATARIVVPMMPVIVPEARPPSAKVASKPQKSFKTGKGGFGTAKSGAPYFAVTFTNSVRAKFTLQAIGKNKKLKTVKGSQLLNLTSTQAPVKFSFAGKWNKQKLAIGRYRVTITPISAADVSGAPVTVDIKLKK